MHEQENSYMVYVKFSNVNKSIYTNYSTKNSQYCTKSGRTCLKPRPGPAHDCRLLNRKSKNDFRTRLRPGHIFLQIGLLSDVNVCLTFATVRDMCSKQIESV